MVGEVTEALRFYASPDSYRVRSWPSGNPYNFVMQDKGVKAASAIRRLAEIESAFKSVEKAMGKLSRTTEGDFTQLWNACVVLTAKMRQIKTE